MHVIDRVEGQAPLVLFIAGSGRSGSTVLDRLLGAVRQFVSVGELKFIWERGFRENQLCSCGEPFRECRFWTAVVREAAGPIASADVSQLFSLHRRVDRLRYLFCLPLTRVARGYRQRMGAYLRLLGALYQAVARVTGARVIVDSSKDPSTAYVLSEMHGAPLRVVHLVRDSRAVAYSWRRRKVRPEIVGDVRYMPRWGPAFSSANWVLYNVLIELIRLRKVPYLRVRYEDFVAAPMSTLARVVSFAGGNPDDIPEPASPGVFNIGVAHTISGNPVRFTRGRLELRLDNEWHREMTLSDRAVVTGLTYPFLARYGYLRCNPLASL